MHRLEFLREKEKRLLSEIYEGYESAFERLTVAEIEGIVGRRLRVKAAASAENLKAAERDLRWLSGLEGFVVASDDERYPPLLREIYDPAIRRGRRTAPVLN